MTARSTRNKARYQMEQLVKCQCKSLWHLSKAFDLSGGQCEQLNDCRPHLRRAFLLLKDVCIDIRGKM